MAIPATEWLNPLIFTMGDFSKTLILISKDKALSSISKYPVPFSFSLGEINFKMQISSYA